MMVVSANFFSLRAFFSRARVLGDISLPLICLSCFNIM